MKKKILVMSKVPFKGITKTRLSKEIGFINSKRLTCNNIEKIKKIFLNKKNEYQLYWYLTPYYKFRTYSFSFFKNSLKQCKGDLGKKIWNLVSLQDGCFVIIGTDIPKLDLKAIAYAFKQLKTSNVVIGPTYDGGFWLIGFSGKRRHVNPFDNIRWSSKNTLEDLIKNLKDTRTSFKFVKKLRDIDNKDDYCQNNID